jgi:hypothetical protein
VVTRKILKKVTRTIFPGKNQENPASALIKRQLVRRCEQKNQRDFLVRDEANDLDRFWNDGLGLRIGSTVFGRAFGTSTMGQPS